MSRWSGESQRIDRFRFGWTAHFVLADTILAFEKLGKWLPRAVPHRSNPEQRRTLHARYRLHGQRSGAMRVVVGSLAWLVEREPFTTGGARAFEVRPWQVRKCSGPGLVAGVGVGRRRRPSRAR